MATAELETSQTPPYVSFKTLLAYVDDLKSKDHLPHEINRSVMPKMSGITQNQVLSALRFLGLVDDTGKITGLQKLVDSRTTAGFAATLASFVEPAYSELLGSIDIASASMKALRERFRDVGKVDGDTLDKAVRFYLKALKAADIKFSSYLSLRQPRAGKRGSTAKSKQADPITANGLKESRHSSQAKDTITIPLHLSPKPTGSITIPEDLDDADCDMIDSMLRAYAKRRQARPAKPR
jgi:hypothetical protein